MKKLLTIFFMIFIGNFFTISAQMIYSNGTGGGAWEDTATWEGGYVPQENDDVFIKGGDSVSVASGITCSNLTVMSGGKLASPAADSIYVKNLTNLEANSFYYNRSQKGTLPGITKIIDPASTFIHMGSGTLGNSSNYEFGNLVIQMTKGCTANADLTIYGNLTINNAAGQVFRGASAPEKQGSHTHTIYGNVYILQGVLSCVDVGGDGIVGIWNVKKNVYVTGSNSRIGPMSSANANGLGIFNIDGDLIIDGGRLQAGTSSSSGLGTGIFNIGGNLTIAPGSAKPATNTLGPFAINFVGKKSQLVNLGVSLYLNTVFNDTVKEGSSVSFSLDTCKWGSSTTGNFVVNGSLEMKSNSRLKGSGNFTLNSGGTLKVGSPLGITLADTVGNIQVAGIRTYSREASYEYNGIEAQVFGDALPDTLSGLTINNPNGILLPKNILVNKSLSIKDGFLDLNSNVVTLGSNAKLSEAAGKTVRGKKGKIITIQNLSAPSGLNIGGLGAVITTTKDLGSTTIERYHSEATGSGNHGILRHYVITPAQNNNDLNATLRVYYDDSELNQLEETKLVLYKSLSGVDNSWDLIGGIINTTNNYVEASGISDFSYWTIGQSDKPLPVEKDELKMPKQYELHQNYPNPFNPETVIKFDLPSAGFVSLILYNTIGERVRTIVNDQFDGGSYSVKLNASDLPSGIYIYTLSTNNKLLTKKMILIK